MTGLDDPVIPIGVLAQKVGLSVSAIRRYEKEGLVISHRRGSGHRFFSYEDIQRVRAIQHMIQDLGLNIEGIRRIQALLPCWNLQRCTSEVRSRCPAYRGESAPCWVVKGRACSPDPEKCRGCPVYRFGSLCTERIKQLVFEQSGVQCDDVAAQELVRRLRRLQQED